MENNQDNSDLSAIVARIEAIENALAMMQADARRERAKARPAQSPLKDDGHGTWTCTIGDPPRVWASGKGGFYRVEAFSETDSWHRWVSLAVRSTDYLTFPAGTRLIVRGRIVDDSARAGREAWTIWADELFYADDDGAPMDDEPDDAETAEEAKTPPAEGGETEDDLPW